MELELAIVRPSQKVYEENMSKQETEMEGTPHGN